jgi:hypothetical protein
MWEVLKQIWADFKMALVGFIAFLEGKKAGQKEFMDKTEAEQAKRIVAAEAERADAEAHNLQHVKERDAFQRD